MTNELLLYIIFECLTVFFEIFIVHQYLEIFFEKRCGRRKALVSYAVFCICLMIASAFQIQPIISLLLCVVGVLSLSILLYNSSLLSKIFFVCLFIIMVLISEIVCAAVISLLGGVDLSTVLQFGMPRILSIVVAKIIQAIIVKIIGTVTKAWKSKSLSVEIKQVLPLLLCQIFSIALTHHVFTIGVEVYGYFNIMVFISMFGIMYMNIIVFWYFDNIRIAFELRSDNEAAEVKLDLQKQYYSALEEHQKETNALHHDIKKHLGLIKSLLKDGHSYISEEYVSELEKQVNSSFQMIQTSQPIISALLTEQNKKAAKLGIELHLNVKLFSEIEISPVDLCVLIGNTFDNAIEACSLLPPDSKRQVNAEIIQRDGRFLISVQNNYDPEIKKHADNDKKHGYGMKNVHKVVAKYNGNIYIDASDGVYALRGNVPATV